MLLYKVIDEYRSKGKKLDGELKKQLDDTVTALKEDMGESEFFKAEAAADNLSHEQAIELAFSILGNG